MKVITMFSMMMPIGSYSMKQIRRAVFETNSSSTHSIAICTSEEFDKFVAGEMYYNEEKEILMSKEETYKLAKEAMSNEGMTDFSDAAIEEYLSTYCGYDIPYSYDSWCNCDYQETYVKRFTTQKGENLVAFGLYGHD